MSTLVHGPCDATEALCGGIYTQNYMEAIRAPPAAFLDGAASADVSPNTQRKRIPPPVPPRKRTSDQKAVRRRGSSQQGFNLTEQRHQQGAGPAQVSPSVAESHGGAVDNNGDDDDDDEEDDDEDEDDDLGPIPPERYKGVVCAWPYWLVMSIRSRGFSLHSICCVHIPINQTCLSTCL